MANYGEELAYWYLRLNGFFTINNFVLHRSPDIQHPSDCDVLAIRMPDVWEEIGGQPDDWDIDFLDNFPKETPIGVICQVKTTDNYKEGKLFLPQHLQYLVHRIGFPKKRNSSLLEKAIDEPDPQWQYSVGKLLIAPKDKTARQSRYLFLSIEHVENFLVSRIKKYPQEKWQDRMFFNSDLFQYLIDKNT